MTTRSYDPDARNDFWSSIQDGGKPLREAGDLILLQCFKLQLEYYHNAGPLPGFSWGGGRVPQEPGPSNFKMFE